MNEYEGVILQASYRIFAGQPVVCVFGKLLDGSTFLIRDHQQTPHFYIASKDLPLAGNVRSCASDKTNFAGESLTQINVATPPDALGVRDRLHEQNIPTYEADVRFAMRYLIDRNIKNGCKIQGAAKPGHSEQKPNIDWVFDDPVLTPANAVLQPSILSFDIETDPNANRLLAIAIYAEGLNEVLVVDSTNRPLPANAISCRDEKQALELFCQRIRAYDPDVITGWNVIDFDLSVLLKVATRVRYDFQLGREHGPMRIRSAEGYFGSGSATIPGRLVLDGMDLVRGAFMRFEEYSLDYVAQSVLGEGKTIHAAGTDKVAEILHQYRHDLDSFVEYALTDARLALQIVEKLDLISLAFARSRITGMTPDRVAASIASFDFLYLAELAPRRLAAPTVRSGDSRVHAAQAGGYVFEPRPGIFPDVWVFDFKSLYPSIIRTFNIDPITFLEESKKAAGTQYLTNATGDSVHLVSGASFSREPGILPGMLDKLFPMREAAKANGNGVASQAIKILMNSFYGVLGTPACRFYNPALANAITGQGRYLLQWSKQWFEDRDYEVLYGDTDSLFVAAGSKDAQELDSIGAELAEQITLDLDEFIQNRWQVSSRVEMEYEKRYQKLFLASVRGGSSGARKRYAGIKANGEVEFVGMEVVRRDWTELAKKVQREIYTSLFADKPIVSYLKQTVADLRAGKLDDLLVYRKGVRKDLASYTASTPPHVAAARKSTKPVGRLISYVMTKAGPEPLDNITCDLDREHYVEKQIRPVAEPVLSTLGEAFEQVIGDDKQLGLFN